MAPNASRLCSLALASLLVWGGPLLVLGGPLGPTAGPLLRAQEPADQEPEELPTIAEKTDGLAHMEGYFDLHWDGDTGKLYLEIDRWGNEFLYQISLATGLGSNPVGLDRGQLGDTHVLEARRVGRRVLLVQPNYRYRARSEDPAEREAVREAFAPSTLWGFQVVAETGDRALVDATDFFLRDAHDVVGTLRSSGQGDFELDRSRSVVHLERTEAFPKNTEVETWLTFTSEEPGPLVRRTAAHGEAVSLRQHHSLVELPEPGYEPREGDPRVGAFGITFHDYARPIDEDVDVRWVSRHRLKKADPSGPRSEPVEPLVYHVDPGTPEPVRSALIEGASWWEDAFAAAGFEDAFEVRVLPDTADPMDLRYNVIHWTHRRTRGWSYGASVVDPRTGEILKANVNLGSLRLRQDRLIGEGLVAGGAGRDRAVSGGSPRRSGPGPSDGRPLCDFASGPGFGYLARLADGTTPADLALARVRQLSAHEVGHTLGLAHNFAASTYGRASVMDYPAPLVRVTEDGSLDLSDAYDVGVGEYDVFAIRWLYADFAEGVDEEAALDSIVREGLEDGMRFLSDADARPAGAAHPLAGLWDNGSDPVEALRHEIRVRRMALASFGPDAVERGEPLARLQQVLVPLYLHHRYQAEVTAHTLGGVDYSYAVRGDGQTPVRPVAGDRQRAALEVLLSTLDPAFLDLPERVLEQLPPPAFGTAGGEVFTSRTAPTFDLLGAAASSADLTLRHVLQPERMARLVDQHARRSSLPGLEEVVGRTLQATWYADDPGSARRAALARTVESSTLTRLLEEAGSTENTPAVRARLAAALRDLRDWLADRDEPTAHQAAALEDIERWLERPEGTTPPSRPPEPPPGSPIGGGR